MNCIVCPIALIRFQFFIVYFDNPGKHFPPNGGTCPLQVHLPNRSAFTAGRSKPPDNCTSPKRRVINRIGLPMPKIEVHTQPGKGPSYKRSCATVLGRGVHLLPKKKYSGEKWGSKGPKIIPCWMYVGLFSNCMSYRSIFRLGNSKIL